MPTGRVADPNAGQWGFSGRLALVPNGHGPSCRKQVTRGQSRGVSDQASSIVNALLFLKPHATILVRIIGRRRYRGVESCHQTFRRLDDGSADIGVVVGISYRVSLNESGAIGGSCGHGTAERQDQLRVVDLTYSAQPPRLCVQSEEIRASPDDLPSHGCTIRVHTGRV